LERAGVPTVTFTGDKFEVLAKGVAAALGLPNLPYVITPHPIFQFSEEEIRAIAEDRYQAVLRALTKA
jgi:hypothetical protein